MCLAEGVVGLPESPRLDDALLPLIRQVRRSQPQGVWLQSLAEIGRVGNKKNSSVSDSAFLLWFTLKKYMIVILKAYTNLRCSTQGDIICKFQ